MRCSVYGSEPRWLHNGISNNRWNTQILECLWSPPSCKTCSKSKPRALFPCKSHPIVKLLNNRDKENRRSESNFALFFFFFLFVCLKKDGDVMFYFFAKCVKIHTWYGNILGIMCKVLIPLSSRKFCVVSSQFFSVKTFAPKIKNKNLFYWRGRSGLAGVKQPFYASC